MQGTKFWLVVAVMAGSSAAHAQGLCPGGTLVNGGALSTLVSGKTLCMARGNERWQEFHAANFDLIDYKLGPNLPSVDPTAKVGTWSLTGGSGSGSALRHTYGATSYDWQVCTAAGGTYTLISTAGAGTLTGGTFLAGQVRCP